MGGKHYHRLSGKSWQYKGADEYLQTRMTFPLSNSKPSLPLSSFLLAQGRPACARRRPPGLLLVQQDLAEL
jgi:hypothetical protein